MEWDWFDNMIFEHLQKGLAEDVKIIQGSYAYWDTVKVPVIDSSPASLFVKDEVKPTDPLHTTAVEIPYGTLIAGTLKTSSGMEISTEGIQVNGTITGRTKGQERHYREFLKVLEKNAKKLAQKAGVPEKYVTVDDQTYAYSPSVNEIQDPFVWEKEHSNPMNPSSSSALWKAYFGAFNKPGFHLVGVVAEDEYIPQSAGRNAYTKVFHDLIPGFATMRQACPVKPAGEIDVPESCTFNLYHRKTRGGEDPFLQNTIIHLNDRHRWTREEIADWLETLDHDLTFQVPEEVNNDDDS